MVLRTNDHLVAVCRELCRFDREVFEVNSLDLGVILAIHLEYGSSAGKSCNKSNSGGGMELCGPDDRPLLVRLVVQVL